MNNVIYSLDDIKQSREISPASARVYCARKVKDGTFIRLKNNLYIRSERWLQLNWQERLLIANRIQTPSYISLLTALAYYEISTQIPIDRIESIAKTRTYLKPVATMEYSYIKIDSRFYFGFTRTEGLFIAEPEKALADCIYLCSFGKYVFDYYALDRDKVDLKKLNQFLKKFPVQTQKWWQKNGII